jgi:hypothetical protein
VLTGPADDETGRVDTAHGVGGTPISAAVGHGGEPPVNPNGEQVWQRARSGTSGA